MQLRVVLYADEGKVLTNGSEVYGKILYLSDDSNIEEYHEIPEAEYEAILEAEKPTDEV